MTCSGQAKTKVDFRCDICIVGAGMVGLTLAQLIVRELPGVRVVLLEKQRLSVSMPIETSQDFDSKVRLREKREALVNDRDSIEADDLPGFDSRSTALSMGSVEVFTALGLWPQLCKRATAIQSVQVSDKGHFASTHFDTRQNQGEVLGYVVENSWLGANLADAARVLKNLSIIAPAEITALKMNAHGVAVTIEDAPEAGPRQKMLIETDLLIVADGQDSRLRDILGIALEHKPYYQQAIVANVMYSKPHRGVAFERFTEQGPLALLPLGYQPEAQMSALIYTRPDTLVETTLARSDAEFLQEIQQAFGFRLGRFTRVSKRHAYPLSLGFAREQIRSSVVLVGNAAHFLHPVAGQGFNLALRDISQLLATLKRAHALRANGLQQRYGDLALLQQYLALQARDQQHTARLSDQFNTVFSSSGFVQRKIRNLGLLGLEFSQGLRRSVFQRMMGASLPKPKLETFHQEFYD